MLGIPRNEAFARLAGADTPVPHALHTGESDRGHSGPCAEVLGGPAHFSFSDWESGLVEARRPAPNLDMVTHRDSVPLASKIDPDLDVQRISSAIGFRVADYSG